MLTAYLDPQSFSIYTKRCLKKHADIFSLHSTRGLALVSFLTYLHVFCGSRFRRESVTLYPISRADSSRLPCPRNSTVVPSNQTGWIVLITATLARRISHPLRQADLQHDLLATTSQIHCDKHNCCWLIRCHFCVTQGKLAVAYTVG